MERLTDHENEHYNQPGCNSCSDYRWRSCKESGEIDDCIQRLTWLRLLDIEDILGDDYDLDRLRELVEADQEGRCVVLPCKAGDTVWVINHHLSRIFENKVTKIVVGYGSDNKNHMETVYIGKYGSATFRKWKLQQIGKTVFFSKEAADAALKGEQDG